jgi:hypothetical protein
MLVSQPGWESGRYRTYVDCNMTYDRGVMRKSNVFVFIMDAIFACPTLTVDLIVDYESALDINLDRSWDGRHANRSTSGIGVGGTLRCSTAVTTNLS